MVARFGPRFDIPTSSVSSLFASYLNYTLDWYLVEFLGANIVDDKPFIVTPYLRNGNVRTYLRDHRDGDRLQIVRIQ